MNQKNKTIRLTLVAVIMMIAAAGFTSCEKYQAVPVPFDENATWHFQADIQPIFTSNCIGCHNGSKSPDLRDGKSYSALSKGYVDQPAETSRLYVQVSTSSTHIPKTTDNQKLMILNWIKQGALNN
jgi:hypothetical protein